MNDASATGPVITCDVCPHACRLEVGALGVCGTRTQRDGKVASLNYGRVTGLALDPIEKKPLARFHPGSYILSYGSFGCNLRCAFCQNSDISTMTAHTAGFADQLAPAALVEEALSLRGRGNIGIAFTYNEPFIAPEYLMDASRLAHGAGLVTAAVTNGYVSAEVWDAALGTIDAYNIDVKCFSEEGYRSVGAPGGLAAVKRSVATAIEAGAHVEVTTLVVPGLSDDEGLFEKECAWLASLDPETPLHITRFFPRHKMASASPTGLETLKRFEAIAGKHLHHVYLGNIH